ncbi:MAG: NAD-dependent epimerase/dehydratase family protein, partial [Desulfovibrionaceae bacterium]|nr:NAD-dependent epimerase/dehydratase family protein [Desulfovibrionaceae bacterium]
MIVITGGAGFIGSVLLRHLNMAGRDDIIVVDNLASSEKWRNLVKARYADYLHRDHFHDLLCRKRLPWPVDAVVHLGACSSTTERNADFLMENNFHYSRDLCRYALESGARFINASSAATYGDGAQGFSDDPALIPGLRPLNMYGYSKQLFDLWCQRH